jgi:thioesterase domain-containing protein/acyl carrier protein
MATEVVPRSDESESGLWSAAESLRRLQAAGPPLRRLEGDGPRPLSFAEERLWFLSQSSPACPADNVSLAWRLGGAWDADTLDASLKNVVARHEALRTAFPALEGKPAAVVGAGDVALRVEDVADARGDASESEALRRAKEESRRPFDLLRGPLLRAVLYRLGPAEALFVVTVHQIVFDGASVRIFARDLVESYRALAAGAAPALPELSVQYTDFAAWQRAFVEQEVLGADVAYWSETLGAPYAPLAFPGTCSAGGPIGPAAKRSWALDDAATERLRRVARNERATDFTVFVAGLMTLLHRRTKADDVVVFASTAGRPRPEVRNVVGLFANVLPLRVGFGGDPTFREVVHRVRAAVFGAFAHQELPFHRIVERLQIRGDAGSHSVFQAMVVFQNAAPPPPCLPGLTFTPAGGVDNGVARFHLLLDVTGAKDGLRGSVKARTDVFPEREVERFGDDLAYVLEAAAANPDAKVSALPVSSGGAGPVARPPVGSPRPKRGPAVAPRDTLERQLANVWEDVFGLSPIGVQDDFFDLGGDSFKAVRIVGRIEALTGKSLPLVTLLEAPTIEKLAALLKDEGWAPRWSSLVPIRASGARPPFYCVHGVGGNILEFEHLARYLDPDQPLYGIQAQGLDGRMPRHGSVEEMAAHYVKEIRELQPHGPYYVGGSSFGGLVAWEVSQRLAAEGEEVGLLVMFDTHGPGFPRFLPTATGLRKRLGDLRYRVELHVGNIAAAKGHRWEYVRAKAARLRRRIARTLGRRLRTTINRYTLPRTIRDVGESGVRANRAYVPKPYGGRVALLRATEQPYGIVPDPTNGWSGMVTGTLEVRDVPGHHGAIMREPRVRVLAAELDACILAAQAPAAPASDVWPSLTSAR